MENVRMLRLKSFRVLDFKNRDQNAQMARQSKMKLFMTNLCSLSNRYFQIFYVWSGYWREIERLLRNLNQRKICSHARSNTHKLC